MVDRLSSPSSHPYSHPAKVVTMQDNVITIINFVSFHLMKLTSAFSYVKDKDALYEDKT